MDGTGDSIPIFSQLRYTTTSWETSTPKGQLSKQIAQRIPQVKKSTIWLSLENLWSSIMARPPGSSVVALLPLLMSFFSSASEQHLTWYTCKHIGSTVLPWRQVSILAICTGLNHEFTLSELVANSTDMLHLRTFPSVEDTPPLTSRFYNTWKNSSLMNSSQHSGHLRWFNSWIEIFWAHCSGKFTDSLDIFSPMEDALPQTTRHLESRICHEGKSTFWPFILDQTTNKHFLSPL